MGEPSRGQQLDALTWTFTRSSIVLDESPTLTTILGWIKEYNRQRRRAVSTDKTTLSRNFKTVDGTDSTNAVVRVLVATQKYMEDAKRPTSRLRGYIEQLEGATKSSDRGLQWTNNTPVRRLDEMAREADNRGLTEKAATLLNRMAVLLIRPSVNDKAENLEEALNCAKRAYEMLTADPAARTEERLPIVADSARNAAWASTHLFRRAVRGNPGDPATADHWLREVQKWKRLEADAELSLKREIAAAVACFHSARARALADDDTHSEIRALRAVVDALRVAAPGDSQVWYHDLNLIITRLCAVDWAYSGHERFGRFMSDMFPESVPALAAELMEIYADDPDGKRERAVVQAVLDIKWSFDQIGSVYANGAVSDLGELERLVNAVDVTDFLHAGDSFMLTTMGLARFAIAVHDLVAAGCKLRKVIDEYALLLAARDHCERVFGGTHNRTFGLVVRDQVAALRTEIERRLEATASHRSGRQIEPYADAVAALMDDFALRTLVSNRFGDVDQLRSAHAQVMGLAHAIDRYIGETVQLSDSQRAASLPLEKADREEAADGSSVPD
ncbi:hypothetical protein GS896_25790 [Rhodococcus hoagii]|nr:hypothetical protein [Prescottella equi]MBM4654081.1 hypothetical protein [Prescottella equi]MBM4719555.1 hypothetical protein [Prescottella equi]NKR23354.1 hypothetical protein [Prescottella equi]NKT56035.1 hypothetical protein [Prescottella equi]